MSKDQVLYKTCTIADSETTSDAVKVEGTYVVGVIVPVGWSGGASVSFQFSQDNSTYYIALDDSATALSVTLTANRLHAFGGDLVSQFMAANYVKVTAAGAVTGAETVTLVLRDMS